MKNLLLIVLFLLPFSTFAQTDSLGVYAIHNGESKKIEVVHHLGQKVSSRFILGAKAEIYFDSAHSNNRFKGIATFRLYFGQPSAYEMSEYYMFTPNFSVKDFGIGRFKVKKNKRYLTAAVVSLAGSTSGAICEEDVKICTKKISPNTYELTVSGKPGEYCIMPTYKGIGGFGGVFDFSILEE